MIVADILTDLKSLIPEGQVKEEERQNHSLGNRGQVTVYPKSEAEIASILKYANENGKNISVMGGGTKRGYGGLVETADILLSLSDYKGIIEHTVGDMTLTVRPGTTFKEIQDYLAEHDQKVSLDPAWPEYATIGGIIAANESGPKRLGYGSARDVVIGMKVVYPNGTIIRTGAKVVKNVAGYDMNKLFIGSMGTLGVVSEVTVKLRPVPKHESLVLLSFPKGNMEEIRSFVIDLLDAPMEPTSLELLSPALSNRLINRAHYTLAISFEDVEKSVHYQENFINNSEHNAEVSILRQKETQAFWDEFYTIRPNGTELITNNETEAALKIGIVNLDVLKVIKEAHVLQDANNLVIQAHGGLGHGLCQVILKGASDDVVAAIKQLRYFVVQLGGYVTITHLPLSLRQQIDVWGEQPSYFFLLKQMKSKIDPNNVLNHKRFVGGI
ncbi:FAD-binding oxidoreductase [Aquibacillus sp. 3ASR75-11]|uniref:FAD-binding oxidoreductase n=1 Tax=Terrihalobacillus insolitus TaxID=2950438 RepID=A0A9X3WTI0_9BACI|nr:FAD-binding oxidoreductase [Terrihalobacillus insolitus]MDC3425667.1 FAD-binding oxidoreductase [Terrihalobacillus insolitus]